jgi:outer membrane receptor for ferrienterochelin and colicin
MAIFARFLILNQNFQFKMKKLLIIFCSIFLVISAFGQGSTTSSTNGRVTDTQGDPLPGANVTATNQSTGAFYGNSADADGYYRISNMKVGGPYTITVSYTGFSENVKENIYLKLGQSFKYNVQMSDSDATLGEVVVLATTIFPGQSNGASTSISNEDIDLLPTLNRDLNDFTRLTPQAKITNGGGFSIAGMNNKFNAVYIDGAVNNDVFGLAANGTNGGQTGISPFSVDILDQIQVVVSPYEVTLGGFAGGGINAVTKSGTNEFKGTAYFFNQNEKLAGKTSGALIDRINGTDDDRERLDEFNQNIYGFSLGGPIVKDKIHFFTNVELQKDETPVPFEFGAYDGNSSEAELNNFSTFLQDKYGYDAGGFGNKTDELTGVKIFGKLDFNLNKNNKLTVRHQYTRAEQRNVNGSNDRTINFENNGVFFPTTTNSSAIELSTTIGNSASNNLVIGYTSVLDDRDPIGQDFPYMIIDDGEAQIRLGSEQFSTANQLDQKIFTITNNFKLYRGKHTLTFGTHNEFYDIYNLFVRQNFGVYEYDSLSQVLNELPASNYERSYSLVDEITGDGSAAGSAFNAIQFGLYAQDEIQLLPNFTLTAGLRIDIPFITTEQTVASDFESTLRDSIGSAYDGIEDVEVGKLPQGQIMFSPRVGFNYDVMNDKSLIIRGGLGIFTSRVPFVWPGGAFNNNGLTVGGVDIDGDDEDIIFQSDIDEQYVSNNFTVPSGQVDLFASDFKYPQVFRTSLAVDKNFNGGWSVSLEGIYTKTLNNVFYQNINSDPTVDFEWTGGPDNRPVYNRNSLDSRYTAVYYATNTNEGSSSSITLSTTKKFNFGLNIFAAYTYGNSTSIFEGTSSQNSSQWRGAFNVDGRNNAPLGRSDFALGNRIVSAVSYVADWTKDGKYNTSISLFYEGQSGDPYSYVYNNGDARNINNETGSTSRNRSLIWIPANSSEINLVDASQWEALDKFIEDDEYLSENRGQYAEKNGSRSPFVSQIDLKILQDLGFKNHKLQLSFDVFNVANLINKDWGVVYSNPFDYRLINFEGYDTDGTTPTFSFTEGDLGNERFNINDRLSRFRARVGIRYIFN